MATIWWREIIRFLRQRSRLVSAIAQPLIFWLLLGGGLNASFNPPGVPEGTSYIEYFYPGIITLTLLFTAIFATISVVQDRREGFLQGVLVAPVSRWVIVLGQALGGTTLALLQGALFLFLAPIVGVPLSPFSVLAALGCDVDLGLWLDKPRINDRVANGLNAGLPCDYESYSYPNLAALRCFLPCIWRADAA